MSFTVSIKVEREFAAECTPSSAFSLLSDVKSLVDLGGNAFRWTMEKIGIGDYTLQQTIYACRYTSDEAAVRIDWFPVEGEGNALVDGGWLISAAGTGCRIALKTSGRLTVDLPGFLQMFLSPLIEMAFAQKIDHYIANLKAALNKN
jgi:hypothetical protein